MPSPLPGLGAASPTTRRRPAASPTTRRRPAASPATRRRPHSSDWTLLLRQHAAAPLPPRQRAAAPTPRTGRCLPNKAPPPSYWALPPQQRAAAPTPRTGCCLPDNARPQILDNAVVSPLLHCLHSCGKLASCFLSVVSLRIYCFGELYFRGIRYRILIYLVAR